MMLAIIGAMIIIDRMTAYWFSEMITMMMPVVIIMYTSMHELKDGALLCVGLIIISFLLGNFRYVYLIYVPVGIIVGMAYSWGVSRNFDRRRLLLLSIITYTFGELLATFIIYPLLGFPVSTMINEFLLAFNEAQGVLGMNYNELFSSVGLDLMKIIGILFIISTVIMGIMEGVLIHILSVFLLKRFKIKDLGTTNIFDIKPNPLVAYLSLIALSMMSLAPRFDNEIVYYGFIIAGIIGGLVLYYYGYIFIVLFGVIVLKRNIGSFFILLSFFVPQLLLATLIIGFLYGSGPLRRYLENKAAERKGEQQ